MQTARYFIAVFETDSSVGSFIEQVLQSEGINAHFFPPVVNFSDVVVRENPSVVLWDIRGCSREDYEQYLEIRKLQEAKNIHFVLTSTNRENFQKNFKEPSKVIFKPFELSHLITTVQDELNCLERVRRRSKEY